MKKGWIRAYSEENELLRSKYSYSKRAERASFRSSFKTELKASAKSSANTIKKLKWGTELDLPNGLSKTTWTKVIAGSKTGFVLTRHLVEIAYVKRKKGKKDTSFQAELTYESGSKRKLLWGDLVQITKAGTKRCEVRARGAFGKMNTSDLTSTPLLEVYFIDVAQGDGVFVRTPEGRHLLIDGGLERAKQQTGKNAADFVDWKFFMDYGHFNIELDSMMASHSDNDHYGGLHDLVKTNTVADRELDALGVDIKTFHHPGLSRWTAVKNATPPHKQGLGTLKDDTFVLLLDDRAHAEQAISSSATEKLSGPWKRFVRDVLNNSKKTKVEQILIDKEDLASGKPLPFLWSSNDQCDIRVLGPVSRKIDGINGLPNFGKKSYNTNGHSICLRVDYGAAKILLTGDLNTESMNWLKQCYGERMGAWECDVAKACHHGSHDISYNFLEKIKAAATVISSGDAEGHSHPRPEIVGASALTGYASIDREEDRLITPLIYMTEIERSVTLGAINRIDFRKVPTDDEKVDGAILGRHVDELNAKAFLSPEDRSSFNRIKDKKKANKFLREVEKRETEKFELVEDDMIKSKIKVNFNLTVPQGPVSSKNVNRRAWKARIMEKNHYGLVNVRTDGKTIMCATLDETEHKWVIHNFPARF